MRDRWEKTLASIKEAALKAGRNPEEIRLVAVSKLHPAEAIVELAQAGQLDFGENYAQEALQKQEEVACPDIRWHFIGRLQTNKAKYLAGNFSLIHSLDTLKMAQALDKRLKEKGVRQSVLLQINVAGEEQKGGLNPEDGICFAQQIEEIATLDLQGLMCMPPFFQDGEKARPYFAKLKKLAFQLEDALGRKLDQLSMGMSADYIQAIEEGATLVRIGTQIFGQRPSSS
jgi:hypothetical protein